MTDAHRTVRARAEALLREGDEFAVATDALRGRDPVLIGYASREHSLVIEVPRSEYDGEELALALGFPRVAPLSAQQVAERLQREALAG